MSINPSRISFAAGSTSLDPFGYRFVESSGKRSRFGQLLKHLPRLRRFLNSSALIVNAYPATLGLEGVAPVVDTYLHPPTFIRAFRLAVVEARPVILAAQPLVGADLILKYLATDYPLPNELLWAVGGYFLPESLERFIADALKENGCRITFLHCYGVAEVGHTCFAAMDRFRCGLPRFVRVADEVEASLDGPDAILNLSTSKATVATGDSASMIDAFWKIRSSRERADEGVVHQLETWTEAEWRRFTGYLQFVDERDFTFQLREGQEPKSCNELEHFTFWKNFGGSFQSKPQWGGVTSSHDLH